MRVPLFAGSLSWKDKVVRYPQIILIEGSRYSLEILSELSGILITGKNPLSSFQSWQLCNLYSNTHNFGDFLVSITGKR